MQWYSLITVGYSPWIFVVEWAVTDWLRSGNLSVFLVAPLSDGPLGRKAWHGKSLGQDRVVPSQSNNNASHGMDWPSDEPYGSTDPSSSSHTLLSFSFIQRCHGDGPHRAHRGPRQGDPLSTFLFLRATEVLPKDVGKAGAQNIIRGGPISACLLWPPSLSLQGSPVKIYRIFLIFFEGVLVGLVDLWTRWRHQWVFFFLLFFKAKTCRTNLDNIVVCLLVDRKEKELLIPPST